MAADAEAEQKQQQLDAIIDGGQTEATAGEVVFAAPAEALELHDNLLQKSPYLSDTVMKEAIDNEAALNNALLRDVLVANPQSAKSENLMQAVDERNNPMPDYMKDEIEEGATMVSAREQLENNLAMARSEADGWYHRMVGDMLNDSAGVNIEALQDLFESRPSPANAYFGALQQLENGDSLAGYEALSALPATFRYNPGQMAEHELMVERLGLLHPVLFSGIPINATDSLTAANLLQRYQNGETDSHSWIRNCLVAMGKIAFSEDYILPDETKSAEVEPTRPKIPTYQPYLKVFPNPARDYVVFEYHTPQPGQSLIRIYNAQGRAIQETGNLKTADQMVWQTGNALSGTYTCCLWVNGHVKATVKFSVVR